MTHLQPQNEILGVSFFMKEPDNEDIAQIEGPRIRETLYLREEDAMSSGSDNLNGSVISSVTDKFGFIAAQQHQQDGRHGRYTEVDVDILRRRETKWLQMLTHWDSYMLKNYKKVRERCRKGIPGSVRARAWQHLCGAKYQMDNPDNRLAWHTLCTSRGDQRWVHDIQKDLHRNFPTHELFGGAYERIGQAELYKVLKAYSILNPVDGYCQAQAPIAALLLMNMPAEEAFWCLVSVCDKYIPGYYSAGMEAIQLDGHILFGLLKKVEPRVHKHIKSQEIEPILYMTEWFLCAFARTLPWASVLRVWDMFCCEGVKVLFRVGLVLLKYSLPASVRRQCSSMYETLDILKNLPPSICTEEFLIPHIINLNITEDDMEKEHRKQLEKRRAMQEERR